MNAIVIEHVPMAELPQAWRDKLGQGLAASTSARVTVRIEQEPLTVQAEEFVSDDPAFGIWRDRQDTADVDVYVRRLRAPRFNPDGSRNDLP